MSSILLFGKSGQVGWELQRSLSVLGQLTSVDVDECDLSDAKAIRHLIQMVKPSLIVNAAAYTAVDKAESDKETARKINAIAPTAMAMEALSLDAWLVHYSTDYVFNGHKTDPYLESDETGPLSVYGQTKLEGEHGIIKSGAKYLIFRTSWVYATKGQNFAKTMLKLAQEREQLRIVADQYGAPTSAELLADVTAQCIQRVLTSGTDAYQGIYHLVASGVTNWFEFASYVIEYARVHGLTLRCPSTGLYPISTTEYPVPAKRPANSQLNTEKIQQTFNVHLPAWQYHVDRMLSELL